MVPVLADRRALLVEFLQQAGPALIAVAGKILGPMGKDIDQGAFELLGVGVAEVGRGEFLEVVVKQPGMVEGRLQHERFPERDGGAMAPMQRTRRQVRTRRHVKLITRMIAAELSAAESGHASRRAVPAPPRFVLAPAARLILPPARRNFSWM